jgi:dihydrofolate reductase
MELIVAVDAAWAIGRAGKLLYSIPEDLSHFRKLTWGAALVLGRKTLATFPGGQPLPGRRCYVLTHHPETLPEGCIGVTAPERLPETLAQEARVCLVGGASLYASLLPACDRAWVTKISAQGGGDAFCPNLDALPDWQLTWQSEEHQWQGIPYRFCRYDRV